MSSNDALCDRFEAAWEADSSPSLESYLAEAPADEQPLLLRELLMIEWDCRRERNETLELDEYIGRFPDLEGYIRASFRETANPNATMDVDAASIQENSWKGADDLRVSGDLGYIRLHAHGGLGEVYVARDKGLQRNVAVKTIKAKHAANSESARRFRLEAEITGRLEHPGVVPVHAMGADESGQPFYVMKFIRGETLQASIRSHYDGMADRKAAENSLEFRKLLSHFLATCQTIRYAHNRGVIHRDIKPENIMVGRFGETLVVDWGLARILDDPVTYPEETELQGDHSTAFRSTDGESTQTEMGRAIGTPAFMSPEQAEGRLDMFDGRTDVYGLGATLYVVLTGQRPFSGDVARVISRVRAGDFESPRNVRTQVPRPLEAICLKAMGRLPEDRYQSVNDLVSDIEAYLDDQPVRAWREPWHYSLQRTLRKRQNLLLSCLLLMAIIAIGTTTRALYLQKKATNQARVVANEVSQVFAGLKLDRGPSKIFGGDYKDADLFASAKTITDVTRDSPVLQAELLDAIGEHLLMSGETRDAEGFLISAYQTRQKHQPNSSELAESLHHVGFLRYMQGHFTESKSLVSRAIKIRTELFGPKDKRTLASKTLYLMVFPEFDETQELRVILDAGPRYVRCWQEVLDLQTGDIADEDVAIIQAIMAGTLGWFITNDREASHLATLHRILQAVHLYTDAWQRLEKSEDKDHPAGLMFEIAQHRLRRVINDVVGRVYLNWGVGMQRRADEELLDNLNKVAENTFKGNQKHPGNLGVRRFVLQYLGSRSPVVESEMEKLHALACESLDQAPRRATFDMHYAEILFHQGKGKDEAKLERADQLLKNAIECWRTSLGEECWQIAEAKKKRARIARDKKVPDLLEARRLFGESIAMFEALGLKGFRNWDVQARGEYSRVCVKIHDTHDLTWEEKQAILRDVRRQSERRVPDYFGFDVEKHTAECFEGISDMGTDWFSSPAHGKDRSK